MRTGTFIERYGLGLPDVVNYDLRIGKKGRRLRQDLPFSGLTFCFEGSEESSMFTDFRPVVLNLPSQHRYFLQLNHPSMWREQREGKERGDGPYTSTNIVENHLVP